MDSSISCKAHGCSNAVVWSLTPWGESVAFVNDAHISIASLRSSADALHANVDMFVHKFASRLTETTGVPMSSPFGRSMGSPLGGYSFLCPQILCGMANDL